MSLPRRLLFPAVIVLGCASTVVAIPPESVAELLASPANVKLVRDAGQADFRTARSIEMITDSEGKKRTPDVLTRGNRTPSVVLSPDDTRLVKELLLDEKSYEWVTSSFCYPTYTVELRFHTKDGPITVALCFGCNQALWSKGAARLGARDLADPAAERLFQVFRRALPDDPVNALVAARREQRALKQKARQ